MIPELVRWLGSTRHGLSDEERITRIRALEEVKSMCSADQLENTAALEASRRAANPQQRADRRVRGLGAEVALARRESPSRGNRLVGMASAIVHEMPHTLKLLHTGKLSEYRAEILVRETACLTREDRAQVDAELCADPATLEGLGNGSLANKAKGIAATLDAGAVVRRNRKALSERRVSCRPAPDGMAFLTALLPMKEAITTWATLRRDATSTVATGDDRTRDQLMADLLIDRITGVEQPSDTPVAVNLIISDETLLSGSNEPAIVPEYGPIPARVAREYIADSDRKTLRKVYANPKTGALTAMESKLRCFPAGLARLIDTRDRTCRTPWCDAPIRHHDHIHPWADGGETSEHNGAGLCQNCNDAKEAGFHNKPDPGAQGELHRYAITTPTGHVYMSAAPALPLPSAMAR